MLKFQSAGRIIVWLKPYNFRRMAFCGVVSIRRADYWLVEGNRLAPTMPRMNEFQSAGRIIGWLKQAAHKQRSGTSSVSIRRADYWLVEANPRW